MSALDFAIGRDRVGSTHPCYIIAEACVNHLGNMDMAREMVVQSKLAHANAVKFQHHLPDAEMLRDVPMSDNFDAEEPLYEFLQKYSLTIEQHKELKRFAEEDVGITYMCTPFSYPAAKELNDIGITSFKIGSGEMTDIPSLEAIAKFGKPMIVSTGMSTWDEIDRTYDALVKTGIPLALTNCVSEYPPEYSDVNIDVITLMRERYGKAVIGHSDHTPDLYTSFAAVTLGSKIIEKHVTLDKLLKTPDQAVSISFGELAQLVDGIRKIEASRGNERAVHDREEQIRAWAFHFVVAVQALKAGRTITAEMIHPDVLWTKRTGHPDGIPSAQLQSLVGKTIKKDIAANSPVFRGDVE